MDFAADNGQFVAVAIDISPDLRIHDLGIALHHYIAANGNGICCFHKCAVPSGDVEPIDVEVFFGIDVVLAAVCRVVAVEILYAGVFPQIHVTVEAECGK